MPWFTRHHALPALRWALLLLIPALWCVLARSGQLTFFENRAIDYRFRARGEIEAPVKIIYVDVDSRSIDEIGNLPWSRGRYAKVTSALIEAGHARAIGLDFVFSPSGVPDLTDRAQLRTGDIEFGRMLHRGAPVVVGASFSATMFRAAEGKLARRGLPLIATDPRKVSEIEPPEITLFDTPSGKPYAPPLIGLIDTLNAGTRTVPVWVPTQTRRFNHMALELARLHWGLPPGSIHIAGDQCDFVRADGSIEATVPLRAGQLVDINWFSGWTSLQNPRESFSVVYTYAEMLHSEKPAERATAQKYFAQDDFRDAIVLIGPVDPLLQDLATTPFDETPVPKVGVHGNLLKTITSGLYLTRPPAAVGYALTFLLALATALLAVTGGAKGVRFKLLALVVVGIYVGAAFGLFNTYHLVLPLALPLGAALTTGLFALGWQLVEEEKQKGRIKGMFGAYVSPQLVSKMVESGEDPQLGGHDSEITAYFSDIQSFSTFSEKLGSGPLVELMNEYLTACTDIVQEEGGTLDKYIGDAVVAMFGAPIAVPDHALRACVATQRVHLRLGELRAKWAGEGTKWPEIVWHMQTRVGLNTGVCMIGNMGSRTRFNYTMMGDNVNLAARMESGAKRWGVYTMCAEATRLACEQHGPRQVVFRPLGRIVVKGRTAAVPIYEIAGLKENVTERTRECLGVFEAALTKYYARDWAGALALFAQSRELEFNVPGKTPGVSSNPSLVYLGITAHYQHEPPPENWDGVYAMKES